MNVAVLFNVIAAAAGACLTFVVLLLPWAILLWEITIENRSSERFHVTPVGTIGREKTLLPIYTRRFPIIPAQRWGEFPVEPGATLRLTYHCDEVQISELLIRTEDGRYFEYVVDANATGNMYRPPDSSHYVVTDPLSLPEARPEVLAAIAQGVHGRLRRHVFTLLALALSPWATLPAVIVMRRRVHGNA